MGVIDEMARRRLNAWLEASHGKITQEDLAEAIGKRQNDVSRYLSGVTYRIELDALAALAGVFGHTLCELLDSRSDGDEGDLIEIYRALQPRARAALLTIARELAGGYEPAP